MSLSRTVFIFLLFLILAFSLSGCGGAAFVPSGWPGISVDGEVAYLAYNQAIYAVRLSDGIQVWRYPKEVDNKKSFFAAPVPTGDGQVIVSGYDNVLYSLSAADGTEKWTYPAKDRFIAAPLVAGGRIYAPNANGTLYALDFQGKRLWDFPAGSSIWAQPVTDPKCTCIYLATYDHRLYNLDAETGELNWGPIDLGSAVVGSPTLSPDGVLYTGTFGREMLAVSSKDGTILWRVPTDGWVWAGPALDGDRLFFGDIEGNFYILSLPDRNIVKKFKPDGSITSSPVVGEAAIYFTSELGTIHAIDREGTSLWNQPVGGKLHTSPVIAGELILVPTMDIEHVLVGLNQNGVEKWKFIPPK